MKRILASLTALTILALPLRGNAQNGNPAPACITQITGRVLQQQRIFRDVLLGRAPAQREPEGAVRYTEDGASWIKTGTDRWVSATNPNTVMNDTGINGDTEWEGMNDPQPTPVLRMTRPGILQTQGVLTSDLLPSVLDAYRAFQCRLAMVCAGVLVNGQGQNTITLQSPGCAPLVMKPLNQCQFANAAPDPRTSGLPFIDPASNVWVRSTCQPLIERVALDEQRMVTLAVSYDAAVRSLLQFSGQFDTFLSSWQTDALAPLRQTVSLVQQLTRIPCFLSQCTNE